MARQQILELEPDERIMLEVRRTRLGLVPMIFIGLIVFFGVLVAIYLIARFRDSIADTLPFGLALASVFGLALLVGLILVIAIVVYLSNRWLITNERTVSVVRRSLFSQDVAQLNHNQIQEVTVKQRNIFENLFNFGTVTIETAGEQNNFVLKLAKKPHAAAKVINDAHEEYENAQRQVPAT